MKIRIDSTFTPNFKMCCEIFNACDTAHLKEVALRQMLIENPTATLQFLDEFDKQIKVERIYKLELN